MQYLYSAAEERMRRTLVNLGLEELIVVAGKYFGKRHAAFIMWLACAGFLATVGIAVLSFVSLVMSALQPVFQWAGWDLPVSGTFLTVFHEQGGMEQVMILMITLLFTFLWLRMDMRITRMDSRLMKIEKRIRELGDLTGNPAGRDEPGGPRDD